LIDFPLSKESLSVVRDLYIFEAFTGYAYAELRSARPGDLREGIDGKLWISKARKKTGSDETLPFLPIALDLIEKYRNHPLSLRRGTLFPVPTNEYYNRCLKEMAREIGIDVLLFSHSARYFFANEVLFNSGVQLKTIAWIMGQDSVKSAEVYVRANRTAVSESMEMVESKLYHPDGRLRKGAKEQRGAKVVVLRAV
jgi:integrase